MNKNNVLIIGLLIITTALVWYFVVSRDKRITVHNPVQSSLIASVKKINPKTIVFVGDIMLDRGVEYLIKKNDVFYPFKEISPFLNNFDLVFGNLEGPIVKKTKAFSDESLMFCFKEETIEALISANFSVLSLANNHTLNMEKEGLKETRELLKENKIEFAGDPLACTQDFILEKDDLVFLAFDRTLQGCEDEEVISTIESVRKENPDKFLVVSLHWGAEYKLKSSASLQQELAHKIIDAKADLIIGGHPHVVQEVEEYNNKLIFYSLGNFIFDQYFYTSTQQGLAIGLEIYPDELVYKIYPLQSHLAQPALMKKEDGQKFLEALAERSSENLSSEIKTGIIRMEKQ